MSLKPQVVVTDGALSKPLTTTKTIAAFLDDPADWKITGIVTPLEKFSETDSLLISHSMSPIIVRKVAVRAINTTEPPYTIRMRSQIAELSVVTPEQSKFIRPVDKAIPCMIMEGEPDLTTYLKALHRKNNS